MIKASSTREIGRLVRDLDRGGTAREAAVARLAVLGTRAVGQLLGCLERNASPQTTAAALRALETIGDARALPRAVELTRHDAEEVAMAAVAVIRALLRSPDPHAAGAALDGAAAIATDPARPAHLRRAAADALREVPGPSVGTMVERLDLPADPGPGPAPASQAAALQAVAEGRLPDDPEILKGALAAAGATAPLPTLHRLVDAIRAREAAEPEARRAEWTALRGAVHQAIAGQGSRVALYDLRETLESATDPLPVAFLAALSRAGDASCLEAIAGAYARCITAPRQDWWRRHLADAFTHIVLRERITTRHRVLKRVAARWPDAARELLGR